LVFSEDLRGVDDLIHEGCFTVVNVCDDRDIPNILHGLPN